ncbi:MAG: phosphatase PAP2 family protein [Candidatus Woykebacteria bacterium]
MDLSSVDRDLFIFINSFVGKSSSFDALAKPLVNEYFVPTVLSLIIFSMWFYWDKKDKDVKQKGVLISVLGVVVGSLLLVTIINMLFQRPRPFEDLDVNLLFYKPTDPSFPANSAVVAFALSTAVFLVDKKAGVAALLLSAFYGFLRVYVGVHFPSDVIAGALIGAGSTIFVSQFDKLLMEVVKILRTLLEALGLAEFS